MRKLMLLFLWMACFAVSFSQTPRVTGQVKDEKGDPIPFATIKIKGSPAATSADDAGNFSVGAQKGASLIVTAAGFESTDVTVGNSGIVSVLMKTQSTLNEVVVTALGIKRQAKELGYSTASISSSELNQAKVINPVTGLAGKVSGLQVQIADNGVNPQVRVTLRGNRSITGNNQALVVVDGVIVENAFLARLNPNDIDNVNVLKGASASALYGSDASNGVLIVTTRKGTKGGKPRINYSSTAQLEAVSYMPKLQDRFGSYGGESFDQILGVRFPNDPAKIYYPYENQSYGPEYNGQMVPLGGPVRIFRADGSYFDSTKMVPYSAVKNGKRNFFDKGLTLQNNVSFASGDATSSFYLSLQNVKVNGIVPKDQSGRNTVRINGSKQYGVFRIDYNTSYTIEKIDQAGGSYFQDRPVYWTVINAPQHANLRNYRNWQSDPFANPNGYFDAYYGNPWWQIDQSRTALKNNNFVGSTKFSLAPTKWLNFAYTVGYSRNDYSFKATKAGFTFADWAVADPWQAGTIPSSVIDLKPSVTDAFEFRERLTGDALMGINKDFGNFSTKLLVGNTIYKVRTRSMYDQSSSLLSFPNLYNIANRQGEPAVGESLSEYGLIGVYGDLTLGYKDFLFLHGTARNDWNSKLAPANRSFFYPSVDASFAFTDLIPFFKNSGILNYGKLRASWAKVGQVSVNPYSLDNVVTAGGGFPYGSQAGFSLSNTFANPNLKPEFTTEKEVGIDLAFLNNRISFKAAVYDAKTTNQTINSQISSATGYTAATINLGSMTNKGIELDLNLTPMLNIGGLKWDIGGNFAYNKNRVGNDLGGDFSLLNSVYASPGQPYPYIKESDWKRDKQGSIIVDAVTGFPTKAAANSGFGTTTPPYKVGLTTSFSYRGFTLSAVADARFGAVVFNSIGQDLDFTGISWYSAQTGRLPFVIPHSVVDDGTGKYTPNTTVATNDANWLFWANTWSKVAAPYINSADFWKLREVSLSYNFQKSLLRNLKIVQGASLTLSGRNLLMFRSKDNVWTDPEFSATNTANANANALGLSNIFQTPPTRIVGATLNVTF